MLAQKNRNNINFIRIVAVLRNLRSGGVITWEEYSRAKGYYKKVTGADIALVD